jgi:murein L,D-transpeptidase YafK
MTGDNMQKFSQSEWIEFWSNLKEGYDIFEDSKRPPNVEVKGRKYIFD